MSTDRKKLDPRIINFVRHGRYSHQRSLFIVRGKKACDAVPILYGILDTVVGFSGTSSLLWCFHKSSGFSLRRKKLFKKYNKRKKVGTLAEDETNALRVFIARTEVRFCYYSETRNILGKTFGACVLQDAAQLSPNVLARAVETVSGGGLIFLLLPDWTADISIEEVAGEDNNFLCFLLASLTEMGNCLVVNDRLDVNFVPPQAALRLQVEPVVPPGGKWVSPDAEELRELQRSLQLSGSPFLALVKACRTVDQARALQQLLEMLIDARDGEKKSGLALLTAARGRGKSAVLGLGVVAALEAGLGRILVTSPSAENVATLLQFVLVGLKRQGLEEMVDFNVHYMKAANVFGGSGLSGKMAHKIVVQRRDGVKQVVRYISPASAHSTILMGNTDLLCIDEAAALPTPLLRLLLTSNPLLTFLATTISGYEGTGHALVQLLHSQLSARSPNPISLVTAIRYAANDPLEAWLASTLCLNAALGPGPLPHLPNLSPDACRLWAVDRKLLFQQDGRVAALREQIFALLAVSDHVTSPDDLRLVADGEEQRLLLLLPPKETWPRRREELRVVAVVQAQVEGVGWRGSGEKVGTRLREVTGDAGSEKVPMVVVKRMVVHPQARGRGFGSQAMRLLYEAAKSPISDSPARLLSPAASALSPPARFLAAEIGLDSSLLRFFSRCNFTALDLHSRPDVHTGRLSCLLLRPLSNLDATFLIRQHARFVRNLAAGRRGHGPFTALPPDDVRLLSGGDSDPDSDAEPLSEVEDEEMEMEETGGSDEKAEGKWWTATPPAPSPAPHGLVLLDSRLQVPAVAAGRRVLWCCERVSAGKPVWAAPLLRAALKAAATSAVRQTAEMVAEARFCEAKEVLDGRVDAGWPVVVMEEVHAPVLAAAAGLVAEKGVVAVIVKKKTELVERMTAWMKKEKKTTRKKKKKEEDLAALIDAADSDSLAGTLLPLCRSSCQARALIHLLARLPSPSPSPLLLTGPRFAGKSSLLGLLAAAAIASGLNSLVAIGPPSSAHQTALRAALNAGLHALNEPQDKARQLLFLPSDADLTEALSSDDVDLVLVEGAADLPSDLVSAVLNSNVRVVFTAASRGPAIAGAGRLGRLNALLVDADRWEMEGDAGWAEEVLCPQGTADLLLEADMGMVHPERCSLLRLDGRKMWEKEEAAVGPVVGVVTAWDDGRAAVKRVEAMMEEERVCFLLCDPPSVAGKKMNQRLRCVIELQPLSAHDAVLRLSVRPGSEDAGYEVHALNLLLLHLRGDTSLAPESCPQPSGRLEDVAHLPSPAGLQLVRVLVPSAAHGHLSLRMWVRAGFRPVGMSDEGLTMALGVREEGERRAERLRRAFLRRFLRRGGGMDTLPVRTALEVAKCAAERETPKPLTEVLDMFEPEDWQQLNELGKGELLDYRALRSVLRRLCRLIFAGRLPDLLLSNLHKQVLLGVAGRQLDLDQLATELTRDLGSRQEPAVLRMILKFTAQRLYSTLRALVVDKKDQQLEEMETGKLAEAGRRAILAMEEDLMEGENGHAVSRKRKREHC